MFVYLSRSHVVNCHNNELTDISFLEIISILIRYTIFGKSYNDILGELLSVGEIS